MKRQLDEKELQEVLALAQDAEKHAKQMCEGIVELTQKYQCKAEAKRLAALEIKEKE